MLGVEPICRVLSEHGVTIAPSTYYEARDRPPSKRALRDAEVVELIRTARSTGSVPGSVPARCGCTYAARATRWPGAPWNADGLPGLGRGVARRACGPRWPLPVTQGQLTWWTGTSPRRPEQAVGRGLHLRGDMVRHGLCRVRLRRVLASGRGVACGHHDDHRLVLDCSSTRSGPVGQDGVSDLTGLVHHTNTGSQYTSFAFTQRLSTKAWTHRLVRWATPTTTRGRVPDRALQDRAHPPRCPWRGVEHVELATLAWVDWFNTERPHESIDDLTPIQAEDAHYAARNRLSPTG